MKLAYDRPHFDSLTAENISRAVKQADTFFADNGVEYEKRTFTRSLLRDMLQDYREQDKNAPFELVFKRRWSKITVTLRVESGSLDVTEKEKDSDSEIRLAELAADPVWQYKDGKNCVLFDLSVKAPDMETLKRVIRYMDSEKGAFRQGVMLRFVNMLLLVLEPWLVARIIEGLTEGDIRKILTYAVLVLLMEAGSSVVSYFSTTFLERAYEAMTDRLRYEVTENVLRIKTEHIDESGTGVFTDRIITETANVANGIDNMVWVLTELFRFISLMIAFATLSPFLMVFEVILFVIYFLMVRVQAKKTNEDSRRVNSASEVFSGFIGETVRASRDIKLLHCEDSFLIRAKDVIGTLTERSLDRRRRVNLHGLLRTQFIAWTDLIFMLILALMMAKHGLSPASALILYNYNGKVFVSARAVAFYSDFLYGLLLSAERVYQLIGSSDYSKETFGDKSLDNVNGDIELKGVSFAYEHRDQDPVPVLDDISLKIPAGQSVALIGRSGCGKSTVFSLISRLYEPGNGCITLDGTDVAELDRDTIRNNIGTVTQSPYLFNMSIRDNFRLVKSDVTDEEIEEVCRTACIHDDIMNMTKGYDTVVGEGGCMLSGGQRQRIALARALLKNYPVIMLDEATSALDNETQATVRDAIKNMHGRSTVLMIAHRLSTVINCEQLFYLDKGKVLASGTHEELLKNCEEYRKLYAEEAG